MNLGLTSLFLVVGLFLSSSALTPEECRPLVTPRSLADTSVMLGRTSFVVGYTNNKVYKDFLKVMDSSSFDITASASSPNEVVISERNRVNGTCFASTMNISIDGNIAKTSFANLSLAIHVLPSCDGCLVFSINTTAKNMDKVLKLYNFTSTEPEIEAYDLFLFARQTEVKDSDLQRFKLQASCLGFSGEPDFLYDPKKELCREDEGTTIKFT